MAKRSTCQDTMETLEAGFDYVIVGSGSAGCVLVGRLAAALPKVRIALVESGRDMTGTHNVSDPKEWPRNLHGPADYNYDTLPQAALGSRYLSYPRGRGLGGSSLINAMIYSRGFREDWDRMPQGWRSADLAPLFDTIEAQLNITEVRPGTFGQAVKDAATELGYPVSDRGGWAAWGITDTCMTTVDSRTGRRVDVYRAMGANQGNVTLVQGIATKVLVSQVDGASVAVGVEIQGRDIPLRVIEGGEVVVCTGAIDTPKLLQLSGIGPSELLRFLHIPVLQDLPVGHGLKDHTLLPLGAAGNFAIDPERDLSPNGIQGFLNDGESGVQLMVTDGATAPGTITNIVVMGLANRPGFGWRILRGILRYVFAPLVRLLVRYPLRKAMSEVLGINVCLTKPSSQGSVMIRSRDPAQPPAIDPNFLSTEEDKRNMVRGLEIAKKIMFAEPVRKLVKTATTAHETTPAEQYVRDNTGSYWHPTGTCAIGPCLDEQLRVRGVAGLRVADASALPVHPRVPPNGACMAVGARCAELLLASASRSSAAAAAAR